MTLPKMTELFIVEANVTTLAQMNKIPVSVAQKINNYDRQLAPQLAQIFANRYRDYILRQPASSHSETFDRDIDRFLQRFAERIVKYIKRNPTKKQQIVDIAKKNWREFLSILIDAEKTAVAQDEDSRKILKFEDGFYWIDLCQPDSNTDKIPDEWKKEGERMQHCGLSYSDRMLSLRDQSGNSHVTLDLATRKDPKWKEVLTASDISEKDVPQDASLAIQVRGKQNKLPDRKYWKYIKDLFQKDKIIMADFEHAMRDHEIAADFEDYVNPPGMKIGSSRGMSGEE